MGCMKKIGYTCLVWLFMTQTVYSEVIQTPDTEALRQRVQNEEIVRQQLLNQPRVDFSEKSAVDDPLEAVLPKESLCFPVLRIGLTFSKDSSLHVSDWVSIDSTRSPFFFVYSHLQQYIGQCVGEKGINTILEKLNFIILKKGYSTTRIGLHEQNLSQGMLQFTLVPGFIHQIRLSDETVYGTWRNAFPVKAGDLLNVRDIEQGVEQLQQAFNQTINIQIIPTAEAGESDIVLFLYRKKGWKMSATLDNSGAKGTGKWQAGFNMLVGSPLGLSDVFNLGINHDVEQKRYQSGVRSYNLYYGIPFGYAYYSLSASQSHYHQQVATYRGGYISSGQNKNMDLSVRYVFDRNKTQKNSVQGRFMKRWARSFINDTELDVQKRHTSAIEVAWIHQHYFKEASFDMTLANRWGVPWAGGQSDIANKHEDYPTFAYQLQTLDMLLNMPFTWLQHPFRYTSALRLQNTRSPLYVFDQFSIGGRYTVRGFDGELTLTAEKGWYWRNEWSVPIMSQPKNQHSLYVGIDMGKVWGPSEPYLVGNKLAGAALGIRGVTPYFQYDIYAGWPLYRPREFTTARPTLGVSLSLTY